MSQVKDKIFEQSNELKKLAKTYIGWFDLEEESDKHIVWCSREHGDVYEESYGHEDWVGAGNFLTAARAMLGVGFKASRETVDEWVFVVVKKV